MAERPLTIYDINLVPEEGTSEQCKAALKSYDASYAVDKTFTLGDLKGQPIILHFWGKNCGPCAKEMPAYNEFSKNNPHIKHIPLSSGTKDAPKEIKHALADFGGVDLPLIVDEKSHVANFFGIEVLPSTILINADGKILGKILGAVEWHDDKVAAFINEILMDKPSEPAPEA